MEYETTQIETIRQIILDAMGRGGNPPDEARRAARLVMLALERFNTPKPSPTPTFRNTPEIRPRWHGYAFAATWLIDAPWAHRLWNQYELTLVDLTTPMSRSPTILLTGATHEMLLFALNPNHSIDVNRPASHQRVRPLHPANHNYQFKAATDEVALERVQGIVDAISQRHLSPDTDCRSTWDALFADGRSLRWGA